MAKRKRKAEHADLGTPELATHHEVMLDTGIKRARVMTQRPIDRYYRLEKISKAQKDAAERFYEDFVNAEIEQPVTPQYGVRIPSGRRSEMSEHIVSARQRYTRAMRALGMIHGMFTEQVVCWGVEAPDAARQIGTAPSSGLPFLLVNLNCLVSHYKIGH